MSAHTTRIRELLARIRISRSYTTSSSSGSLQNSRVRNTKKLGIPRKPRMQDLSDDMPPRSFLLDPPTKPVSKRAIPSIKGPENLTPFEKKIAGNPYAAILATPVRQCLYTRLILPNAFLTKFIQAEGPDNHPWIVPERILPHNISRKPKGDRTHVNPRNGFGKWMATTSAVIDGAIREGRYRVINPAGFMRQDMTSLVYAQWSIRITHEFRTLPGTLFSEANKKIPSLRHPLFIALDGSQAHPPGTKRSSGAIIRHGSTKEDKSEVESRSVLGFRSAQNVELPCVLYFGKGLQLAHGAIKKDAETLDESVAHGHSTVDSTPVPEGSSWKDIDITKPELPVLAKDRLPFREQMEISQSNGRKFTSPVYDIERLFAHHPQGLEVIKSSCLDLLPRGQRPSDDHDSVPMWVGIRGSKATIPVCVGLWKLASM